MALLNSSGSMSSAGDADRVRTDAEDRLEVLGVHEQADEVVFIHVEPKEHAAAHVVDAALHRAVHRLGVVGVVALRPRRMQVFVRLFIIGLLEEDIRPDTRLLEAAVVFDRRGGDVDVHAADRAVFVLDAVDRFDALEHIFNRAVDRILARLEREALVAHVLQRDDLPHDVLLGELLAGDVLVVVVVGAVTALVDAVVGEVEGGEHDDAVAVVLLLDLHRERVDFFDVGGVLALEQHRRLAVGEPLQRRGLLQNLIDEGEVRPVLFGVRERFPDLSVVNKFGCDLRLRIVHGHSTFLYRGIFPKPRIIFSSSARSAPMSVCPSAAG